VAGSFLSWVEAEIPAVGVRTGTGWRNIHGNMAHGPWLAALGALMVIAGAVAVFRVRSRGWSAVGLLAALGAAAFVGYEVVDIRGATGGIITSLGAGIWVMLAGAVLGVIGAAMTA